MNFMKLSNTFKTVSLTKIVLHPPIRMSSNVPVTDEVRFEFKNYVGIITLNRPRVLNSLNESMVKSIYSQLKEWESKCNFVIVKSNSDKAFCAGGDVVSATRDKNAGKSFFRNEYKMNYLIGNYRRPYIAICDGITMGGGVGLSVHGTYRIITEKTLFAMPETQIGLFPDVGGSYFLPRLKGRLGLFLGLTGQRLQGIDVVKVGVGTHYLSSSDVPDLVDKLLRVDADRLGEFLNSYTVDISKNKSYLEEYLPVVNSCFYASTVEEIHALLWRDGSMFAKGAAEMISRQSPTSLKITKKALDLGANMTFRECLKMEYRLANAALEKKASPDFYEGKKKSILNGRGKGPLSCAKENLVVATHGKTMDQA